MVVHQKTSVAHNQLRAETTIESDKAFISEDLSYTVHTILVQKLADDSTALVLHSCLCFELFLDTTALDIRGNITLTVRLIISIKGCVTKQN